MRKGVSGQRDMQVREGAGACGLIDRDMRLVKGHVVGCWDILKVAVGTYGNVHEDTGTCGGLLLFLGNPFMVRI